MISTKRGKDIRIGLCQNTLSVLFYFFLLISSPFLYASPPSSPTTPTLYFALQGDFSAAIERYKEHYEATHEHDFNLLQQLGLMLLEQGWRSKNPEDQLLSLFGAGIALNDKVLPLLERGIDAPHPQLQVVSLNLLARYQNDIADLAILRALSSPYLGVRMEALHLLCVKKHPRAIFQAEALMQKVPEEALVFFPKLVSLTESPSSSTFLRRYLSHPNVDVRIEAILAIAASGRDDLLENIRRNARQHDFRQQEAAAYALGIFHDREALSLLRTLSTSLFSNVRLAALYSLYKLGEKEVLQDLIQLAHSGDLFAITLLGKISGAEDSLYPLTKSANQAIRINATLALLERHDPRCLDGLAELLIKDSRDLVFIPISSPGKALSAWKVIPSATEHFDDLPLIYELSLQTREDLIFELSLLQEKDFLRAAVTLLESNQHDLIPVLIHLLEEKETPAAIQLLKTYQQKAGAPLIRCYCHLALVRLKEADHYESTLKEWVLGLLDHEMIRLRPVTPWDLRQDHSEYQLTPQETSRLLVEAFETLSQLQTEDSIDLLLTAIQKGNTSNRYALAGLLIRVTQ